ncbi:TetR/AcrR family transcriptional regulator [Roseomonas eburnea]|uniref:TetR/AcrR family transcriptional regulator n=1 Tax=Neoroseomonas eburnea TaxID=1346889 RepID=A0A9X9XIG8_9PROT|nr:TetR/AcrR family transcriptional regulator [Neoroseomonas eburnea]MBR0683504.1 TetR/AcrR family transcriptional regulator [Neoroseomonas eburnea]
MDASATTSQPDARTRILDAVERIVQARGVTGLTLEAAAREAGVSKGGLLYHFGSKEALLTGLMERLAAFMGSEFDNGVRLQPEGPGRVARAMIAWAFGEGDCVPGEERHDRAAAVFLAAFHHDPALLDPMRAVMARIKAELLSDGIPPGPALAILTATDGLFNAHVFGLYRASEAELSALRATLEQLLEART